MTLENASHPLSRRAFLQAGATCAATLALDRARGAGIQANRQFEHGNPLHEFDYADITLAPGLHLAQLEQARAVLMGLNEDSLLRPFRMAEGQTAPGIDLGGWYSNSPGYSPLGNFGQWLSALSRYYAITGDGATREKVERLIRGFSQTVEPGGKVFKPNAESAPAYGYDKIVIGLVDSWRFAKIDKALPTLAKATEVVLPLLPGSALDYFGPEGGANESYTLAENQFVAWQSGAGEHHYEMAKRYIYDSFFEPLAAGKDVLAGRHAYSHVNALSSAAKAYLVLGDESYLKAAINGFGLVEKQSFATGGWGPGETFLPKAAIDFTYPTGETIHYPAIDSVGESVLQEDGHFETPCGAYAHFKLSRYLLRITKDSHYGDSMERVMYNTVLGALPLHQLGKAFYQSNYHHHARKMYFDGYGNGLQDEWPCCSGTLPQLAADYQINTYFRDPDGIFVNLYIPSMLRWKQGSVDIALTQSGQYPLAEDVAFEVSTSRATRFTIRLRIPAWAEAPSLRINGKPTAQTVRSGSFAAIRREWKNGDRICLNLPRSLRLKPADAQHPDLVALVSGPLVLFAVCDDTPKVTRAQLLAAEQQGTGTAEWKAQAVDGALRLLPWWAIHRETYFTYLSV